MGTTAVIGSVFVDMKGFPFSKYNPTGTNIGDVKIVHGGVSRNVAENMANINADITFVTMFETDGIGEDVRRRLAARGVDLKYAVDARAGMGMWLAVMDEHGELRGSVSRQPDFSAMDRIISTRGDEIMQDCDNIVLEIDMNAPIAAKVLDLAHRYARDVYVIVGNMGIIGAHPEFLRGVKMLILNDIEAGLLFGSTPDRDNIEEVKSAVRLNADRLGIRELVVTLGANGAVYYDSATGECDHVPAYPARMVDSTGAGDAFFSGTVAARIYGKTLHEATRKGSRLAAMTIRSEESTCPCIEHFLEEDA